MLKNNKKMAISKYVLFSLLVICLIFTSSGFDIEHAYAADTNETGDEMGFDLDAQDKLENSQENSIMEAVNDDVGSLDGDYLGVPESTFENIERLVGRASPGDTIDLHGIYYADNKFSPIIINKPLTITSSSGATLDGQGKSLMFDITGGGAGTVIKNIKFINGEYEWGSAIRVGAKNVVIDNCIFENNHCYLGGAVATEYNLYDAENFIIKNCQFIRNTGYHNNFDEHSSAGALGAFALNSQVINCVFDSNWVKGKDDAFGGALQIGLDEPNYTGRVVGCTFRNNAAIHIGGSSHGGAGCVRNGVDYIDCVFINNTADQGGALTFHASGNIINCVFINNTANNLYGGALSTGYLYDSMVLNIADCTFEGNNAPEGGAIQAIGTNVGIRNSEFRNNHAATYGGAVTVQATNVNIDNSIFKDNWVDVNGGAVYIKGVDTTVKDSSFISNDAVPDADKLNDGLGGAIYISSNRAKLNSNKFFYNTARNGSAIYYDSNGENLNLEDNILYQNQAWVYGLPISAENIFYGDREAIKVIIYGGNNIADYDNLGVSNAIYNAADNYEIEIDGEYPVNGATNSGELYQDGREYNIDILLTVQHEDGTVVYNNTLKSSYLGEIDAILDNLKPGVYYVAAEHFEDTYYKGITNITSFTVYPKVDNQIIIFSDKKVYDFEEVAVWTVNVTNNGPNDSTEVAINNLLPEGLIYFSDTSGGRYDSETGILNVSTLDVGEKLSFNIITIINKTGIITNNANITAKEFDTNLTNNFDEQSIMVNPAADIVVIKSVNNTRPNYRDMVNWTIVVKNNGPDIAHNITVQDIIPKTLIPVYFSGNYDSKRGIWELDSLDVDEEVLLNVITIVNSTGLIENNVYASAEEFDYDLSNNKDDEFIRVDPASDLLIIKSVNATAANYLDIVKWMLTISNNGPDNATGVKISDILPEGFTYISSTWDLVDGEINVGNLSVGQTVVIDIVCRVDTTGDYSNIANITGNEYDHDLSNNRDNASITVYPAADLEISKSVNATNPKYGQLITWTVTVKNNGPDIAHEIKVYEVLPDSLIWIEDDSLRDYNPKEGIWTIEELDVDEEISLEIICKVNKTGLTVNHVNVTASEYDYNLTNNYDNESIETEPSADVCIIKLVNNTYPDYNDLIKWTVIVSNNGPDKATGVEVSEKLPEGLILVNSTASKGIYDNDLWAVCCLEKGEVQTLELICQVNRTGNLTNHVKVSANEYDPNSANNEANESIDVPPAVDIEVIHEVNNTNPLFGEKVIWMITVRNNGPDNATDVELTDIMPDSLIFVTHESTTGEYGEGIWNVGKLNVGDVEYLNITCIANSPGMTVNDAYATSFEYDWNESNNYDDALINVVPVADLSIQKFVDKLNPNYLDFVTWTLKILNNGPNDASNVNVFDTLPDGLEFVSSSDDANYRSGNWHVGELKIGQVRELSIKCKVVSSGLIKNSARVWSDSHDPNLDNNHAEETISVRPSSDLSITKVASKYKYVIGDVIGYMIEVVNNGPDTAYNIKISEIWDDLLKLKSFKVSKGKFNKFTHVWTIDSLEYGESARLYIKAVALGTGVIKNSVSVTSDSFDYDMSNNKDFAIVKVVNKTSNIQSNLNKDEKSNLNGNLNENAKMHNTANPFALLIVSLLFSLIFPTGMIQKKR